VRFGQHLKERVPPALRLDLRTDLQAQARELDRAGMSTGRYLQMLCPQGSFKLRQRLKITNVGGRQIRERDL